MNNPAQKSYQLYIGGEWVDASDGGTLDVYCPANGEQLSVIADATKEDVDRAVDAAWEAFETWSKTTKAERAIILNKVADLIEENAEKLALLESLDNGKPIRETRAIDVAYSVDHFRYFAGVLLAARMNSGQPSACNGLEFDAITAAVLGGTAFTGGVGTIFGTFLGMLVLQGFKTGLNMVGVQTFWQQVAQGGLLVVALAFDFYRKHTRDKRALEESMAARGAQLPNKKARA